MMLLDKGTIIASFKYLTMVFIVFMLFSGVTHLKKDYDTVRGVDPKESTSIIQMEEMDCKTPFFMASFAFVLGAFWNQNKIIKFGVI